MKWYASSTEKIQLGDSFTPVRGITKDLPTAISHAISLGYAAGTYGTVYSVSSKDGEQCTVDAVEIVRATLSNIDYCCQQANTKYGKVHLDEDCRELTGTFENERFFNCTFDKLGGLSLINCDLNKSKFKTSSIKDALGFTVTLDCQSFTGVELSPFLLDLALALLTMTKGNQEKLRQLRTVIGEQKYDSMRRLLALAQPRATV